MIALIFDIEIYRNYFLVSFLNAETGAIRNFEMHEDKELDVHTLRQIVRRYRLVSFNGNGFDLPLLTLAMNGASVEKLKDVANKIILNNIRPWAMGIESVRCDHIDIIEVAPGMASLKIYGGRLHCPRMQDLPIEPEALITPEQRPLLREYCGNDLHTTLALYRKLMPQIQLREQMGEQYGIDLRSKSDAQIAEAVIRHEIERSIGRKLPKPQDMSGSEFQYKVPGFITFASDTMHTALEVVRSARFIIQGNGQVKMPEEIANLAIHIGESTYRMGIGGLHSTEKSVAHVADDDTLLVDRDVTSYYPNIILNCGLRPTHMGEHFTKVYRQMVEQRVNAKHKAAEIKARIAELEMELKNAN